VISGKIWKNYKRKSVKVFISIIIQLIFNI
jgi:hypothetical protein